MSGTDERLARCEARLDSVESRVDRMAHMQEKMHRILDEVEKQNAAHQVMTMATAQDAQRWEQTFSTLLTDVGEIKETLGHFWGGVRVTAVLGIAVLAVMGWLGKELIQHISSDRVLTPSDVQLPSRSSP